MNTSKILNSSGWYILAFLSIVPLALWIFGAPIWNTTRSIGDIFGLCGMAMFSLVLILSARFKWLEKFFHGMNEVYSAHHFFGGIALCLLLFHPVFLAYNYLLVSFREAAIFLLPGSNLAQNFGIFGLFLMIVALVITFYTKLKYQTWKFTHKFLGLAFIFAFLHTLLIGADIASNNALKIYLFVLGITAIIVYFYRTLLGRYFGKTFDYTVNSVKALPDKIWEIEFKPINKEINFTAGQFVFLKLYKSYLPKESHPFSLTSAPGNQLKLAIKELGDYTNKINEIRAGDLAVIEGPFGTFDFRKCDNKSQVWIAGGVGITPFISMLRSLSANDYNYEIDLFYSVKDENMLAFKEEIEQIANSNKNLKVKFWITNKDGFITAKAISETTENILEKDILICGPNGMMLSLKKQFLKLGIKKKQMHIEEFQLY